MVKFGSRTFGGSSRTSECVRNSTLRTRGALAAPQRGAGEKIEANTHPLTAHRGMNLRDEGPKRGKKTRGPTSTARQQACKRSWFASLACDRRPDKQNDIQQEDD